MFPNRPKSSRAALAGAAGHIPTVDLNHRPAADPGQALHRAPAPGQGRQRPGLGGYFHDAPNPVSRHRKAAACHNHNQN